MRIRKSIKGIYAIWYREFKVFLKEKSRVFSSLFLPLLWFYIFGAGIGSIAHTEMNYQHFIFPGFLVMTIIFSAMFNGAYILWDKKVDFLKEILIAPHTRTTVFIGKICGGLTDSLLQSYMLLCIGVFIGVPFTLLSFISSAGVLLIFAVGIVSLGLIMGSMMESPEGFGLIASFVVYPLFLLSGALYPIDNLPGWMQILTHLDPATYAVDALRQIILGSSTLPLTTNLLVIVCVDMFLIMVGTWAFRRMKL